jgi:hypothetical protein
MPNFMKCVFSQITLNDRLSQMTDLIWLKNSKSPFIKLV